MTFLDANIFLEVTSMTVYPFGNEGSLRRHILLLGDQIWTFLEIRWNNNRDNQKFVKKSIKVAGEREFHKVSFYVKPLKKKKVD